MLLRQSGRAFAELTSAPSIMENRLADLLRHHTGHRPSPSEAHSWSGSLPILAHDLVDAGLSNVEVLVEYQLPLTSRRADVVLAGRHPKTGEPSFVVVELKQWSAVAPWEDAPDLVSVPGAPGGPRLHPVVQVRRYCEYLVDFVKVLHDLPDSVAGAAYLHNADLAVETALSGQPQDVRGRVFTSAGRDRFLQFLQQRLAPDVSGAPYADLLLRSGIAPSTQLMAVVADELENREQFKLLDEQQVAVDVVLAAVEKARMADHKTVVVISGGPGTGKSVIALSLMGELASRGRTVVHATGSRAFTQTLRDLSGRTKQRAGSVFKYFNQFMDADRNGLDVLILDEAHRLRSTSESRYTPAALRTGRPQVDELLAAARVPVFLLDEYQVVRPGEMGTVGEIEAHAEAMGLDVQTIALEAQFRCGGSDLYVRWVVDLLGLTGNSPWAWTGDDRFQLDVADSPEELESRLRAYLDQGYGARMTAGYCWPWSDPRADKTLVPDVQIDGWSRPWNSKSDRALPGAPPSALWASRPDGFGQVGCVYTAQGFEYDWNGVILGPDLVWRTDRWVSRREFNKDPDFRSPEERQRCRVRPAGAQRLQGPADPRDGRDTPVQRRSRDAGADEVPGVRIRWPGLLGGQPAGRSRLTDLGSCSRQGRVDGPRGGQWAGRRRRPCQSLGEANDSRTWPPALGVPMPAQPASALCQLRDFDYAPRRRKRVAPQVLQPAPRHRRRPTIRPPGRSPRPGDVSRSTSSACTASAHWRPAGDSARIRGWTILARVCTSDWST